MEHTIELEIGTKPIKMNPYRKPKRIINDIEEAIKEFLELGLLRPSSNPYASLVIMVKKKDGTLRMCIDFRALNKNTVENRYPIPKIYELMNELHQAKLFSKIDLRSGYHQIRMRKEGIPKTAFRCHYGHFEFVSMPFGLKNRPTTFQ